MNPHRTPGSGPAYLHSDSATGVAAPGLPEGHLPLNTRISSRTRGPLQPTAAPAENVIYT